MTEFLLARHGETRWTEARRYQGRTDVELNPRGWEQAKMLRDKLSSEAIDAVYSSDLRRARATAEMIASHHGLKVKVCWKIRELDFGKLEGLTFEEVERLYPEVARKWIARSPDLTFPGGESLWGLCSRVAECLRKVERAHRGERILVVGHGGSTKSIICTLMGWGLEHWYEIHLAPASLTMVEVSPNGSRLIVCNDTSHLRG